MTATNHALTGAIIGTTIHNPAMAITFAVLSHFLLDSLPHFGFSDLKSRDSKFTKMLLADIALCVGLVVLLFFTTTSWLIISLCAFMATLPDIMWLPDYVRNLKGSQPANATNWLIEFHSSIQWSQTPKGGVIEMVWAAVSFLILIQIT